MSNNGWMPIESAPKDGSAITVYDMYQTDFKKNSNGIYRQTGRDGYGVVTAWFKDGAWLMHSRDGVVIACTNPAHWMPIPAPPTGEDE
ncbi:hypothetical protein ABB26_05200 [Stenotrophomonas humi]|uniref:DUF551 domain-containing protein n=1 Tax=Stenotrophomonas humi TaxID=405444 RepID=A0A0R0CFG1_9GAMM|nr:hypothetical protein [Stenotrophomonas humi]KRG65202.1 hypothetical protein ABB26_05200 [Stenotrophomonas humi]